MSFNTHDGAARRTGSTQNPGWKSNLEQAWRDVVHQSLAFGWRVPWRNAAPCESLCWRHPHGFISQRDRTPARHKSKMAGATRTAMRSRQCGSSPFACPPSWDPVGQGDHALPGQTKGIAVDRYPRRHRRSGVTMAQSARYRKQIISWCHEPALINIQRVNPHPIC